MKRKSIISLLTATVICLSSVNLPLASEFNEPIITQEELDSATPAEENLDNESFIIPYASNSNYKNISGGRGKITSNAWRSTNPKTSGNTYQWDYQVSAVYTGNTKVNSIRTTWKGSASLKNSASINLGISASGGNAGAGSSWQNVSTVAKYWENNNGAKESSYRSNMIVTPSKDYRPNTIAIVNTAKVILDGDPKPHEITASC